MRKSVLLVLVLGGIWQSCAWATPSVHTSVTQELQGIWALPDCANAQEGLIITSSFYLRATETDAALFPLRMGHDGTDYKTLVWNRQVHFVRREADGLLKIAQPSGDIYKKALPKKWETVSKAGAEEYTRCEDAPEVIPVPLVRVMQHVEAMAAACSASTASACRGAVFRWGDGNKDGHISQVEIKKAFAQMYVFAALTNKRELPIAALEDAYKNGVAQAYLANKDILLLMDKDSSHDLSLTELALLSRQADFMQPILPVLSAIEAFFSALAQKHDRNDVH